MARNSSFFWNVVGDWVSREAPDWPSGCGLFLDYLMMRAGSRGARISFVPPGSRAPIVPIVCTNGPKTA